MDKNSLKTVSSFLNAAYQEGLKGLQKDIQSMILEARVLVDELIVEAEREEVKNM